jgi:hypothetical protein
MPENNYSTSLLQELMVKLSVIESKVIGAKALNGGFEQLVEDVAEIGTDVRSIKKSMYEPDSGLFTRVRELETESVRHQELVGKPALAEHHELMLWKRQVEADTALLPKLKDEVRELTLWKSVASKFIWALLMLTLASWFKTLLDFLG